MSSICFWLFHHFLHPGKCSLAQTHKLVVTLGRRYSQNLDEYNIFYESRGRPKQVVPNTQYLARFYIWVGPRIYWTLCPHQSSKSAFGGCRDSTLNMLTPLPSSNRPPMHGTIVRSSGIVMVYGPCPAIHNIIHIHNSVLWD